MIKIYEWSKTSAKDRQRIMSRSQSDMESISGYVGRIIKDVRKNGDSAVVKYTRKFDNPKFTPGMIKVTKQDIAKAYRTVSPKVIKIMRRQIKIYSRYAKTEKSELVMDWKIQTTPGVTTGMRLTPMDSVGLYIPGRQSATAGGSANFSRSR